jgi:hypothetical protein
MESAVRVGMSLVVISSIMMGALRVEQRWIKGLAGDLWDLPGEWMRARQQDKETEKIDAESRAMKERLARKKQIAEAVARGELSLHVAAEQFLEVAKNARYDWDKYRETHARLSLRARCALLVIDEVEMLPWVQDRNPTTLTASLRRQVEGWQGQ